MANGFNVSDAGHTVLVVPPQNITGGITGQCFSMKGCEHASIIIAFGATASPPAPPTSIVINQCTNPAGSGATALPTFKYFNQTAGGPGNDILNGVAQKRCDSTGPPNWAGSEGITGAYIPASFADLVYLIEIDSAELDAAAAVLGPITEYPYIQVVINNAPGNTIYCAVIAILSGERYGYNIGASATV